MDREEQNGNQAARLSLLPYRHEEEREDADGEAEQKRNCWDDFATIIAVVHVFSFC